VKVNITFMENQGKFYPEKYTLTQGMVDYAGRPQATRPEKFPAISARTMVVKKNMNGTSEAVGPWETLPFKGNGTYKFNIAFDEKYIPGPGDLVHISIIVSDKNGSRIGYVVENKVWV